MGSGPTVRSTLGSRSTVRAGTTIPWAVLIRALFLRSNILFNIVILLVNFWLLIIVLRARIGNSLNTSRAHRGAEPVLRPLSDLVILGSEVVNVCKVRSSISGEVGTANALRLDKL